MSQPTPSDVSATSPAHAAVGALPVLGMLGAGELGAFTRLAADSAVAPSLTQRLALVRLAGQAFDRLELVTARVAELGGDVPAVLGPFTGVLVEFDRRTEPATWWERLLKAYIGYGVADDVSRAVADMIDPTSREVVMAATDDEALAELVVDALAGAVAQDPPLASRLALWGRRLFGESLGVVQRVLAAHPDMEQLLEAAMPGEDVEQRLFAALTANHSRRMGRLGLTP